jgi:hypothetical protein
MYLQRYGRNSDPRHDFVSTSRSHISLFTDTQEEFENGQRQRNTMIGAGMTAGGTLGTNNILLTTTDSCFESNNLYQYSESNYNPSASLRNTVTSAEVRNYPLTGTQNSTGLYAPNAPVINNYLQNSLKQQQNMAAPMHPHERQTSLLARTTITSRRTGSDGSALQGSFGLSSSNGTISKNAEQPQLIISNLGSEKVQHQMPFAFAKDMPPVQDENVNTLNKCE